MRRSLATFLSLALSACAGIPATRSAPIPAAPRSILELARGIDLDTTHAEVDEFDLEPNGPVVEAAPEEAVAPPAEKKVAGGVLRDRFRDTYRAPDADEDPFASPIVTDERRPSGLPVTAVEDSLDLGQPWASVRSAWRAGAAVPVRGMVWPSGARVVRGDDASIQVATDWIKPSELGGEMACAATDSPVPQGVRLVGALVPTPLGGVLIRVGVDVQGPEDCLLSERGQGRVRAFAHDLWISAHRMASASRGVNLLR